MIRSDKRYLKCLPLVALCGLLLGIFLPSPVLAATKRKVIRLEDIKVEGRIQKPQAFYIIQRSNLNFEGLKPKRSFIPDILNSVEKNPF